MTTLAIVILATAVIVLIVRDKYIEASRQVDAVLAWDQACADEFDHDLATIRSLPETRRETP